MCLSEPQPDRASRTSHRAVPDGADFTRATRWSRAIALRAATRCGSRTASTRSPRTSSTSFSPRSPTHDGKLVPGTRGISLFIVPKKLVGPDGALTGERNDVALAGLNHKLGYRGIPNTLLNFGEGKFPGARRERGDRLLVGTAAARPALHVPHDERGANRRGLGATMLGFAGYEASLEYAKTRPQGRPIGPAARTREAAGSHHRARRRQAHAARAEELLRRRPRARASLRQARRRAAHR
jgi:butyryl-CoA dehydrogenase